ncbi:MAG: ATP-binding protein [Candidatus Aminicenantes bacterium]|nr:ATP-binding protein [Candidatus Aminicenantes bacterium]
MTPAKIRFSDKAGIAGLIVCLTLSLAALSGFLISPVFFSNNYYGHSLKASRQQREKIRQFFLSLEQIQQKKEAELLKSPLPENDRDIYRVFRELQFQPKLEGTAYYREGQLELWEGNVVDVGDIFPRLQQILADGDKTAVIHHKASWYLIRPVPVNEADHIVLYQLLAFLPQFKAPYLDDFHVLGEKLLRNCRIEYHDFSDSIPGYERIFREKDEYIGEPRMQGGVLSYFFPLRTQNGKIAATLTLDSPPLVTKLAEIKESFALFCYLFLLAALVILAVLLIKSPFSQKSKPALRITVFSAVLLLIRFLFFPLSRIGVVQSLSVFSPTTASFISFWNLTKSPADIFLTALTLFLFLQFLFRSIPRSRRSPGTGSSIFRAARMVPAAAAGFFLLSVFQTIFDRLVFNSTVDFFHFTFQPSFLLLHFSLLLFFGSFVLVTLRIFRSTAASPADLPIDFSILAIVWASYSLVCHSTLSLQIAHGLLLSGILLSARFPGWLKRKRFILASILLLSGFFFISFRITDADKTETLLRDSLQHIIKSQENWGHFLMEQSLHEIDREQEAVFAFLKNVDPYNFARLLWDATPLAKFNKYSRLEILTPRGTVLSHFALNVPEIPLADYEFPLSREWMVFDQDILYLGRDKDFLIAYKDWFAEEQHVGRMIVFLMIDYETLPFLFSANPYFEVMRSTSMPSLDRFDPGFAIFDLEGHLVYNPKKITTGIPPELLNRIPESDQNLWADFVDKGTRYSSLYFRWTDRIFSLFVPVTTPLSILLNFLKLLLFFGGLYFLAGLIHAAFERGRKLTNPFWSFSNRVYISFVLIALFPLMIFAFSTRSFFDRIFSAQFMEKAEVHAEFARRVMEDYAYLQTEERTSLSLPPDNIVLWISSTIANDVNLYQDGLLVSSSRREFFDYGLLPELIDGEIYNQIQYNNNPYYTQTQTIGNYSFHTLTIPYKRPAGTVLISLPFPLERQELSRATEDLMDFLFLLSIFLIFAVLPLASAIGGMIINPVRRLLTATREVSLGNLEIVVDYHKKDEMRNLMEGFNSMIAALKKHQQDMTEMSKKVAWAEMARKVAHEIKNPLTPIQLSAEHLLTVYRDNPDHFEKALHESTTYIISEVENLRKIAHEFMKIAKEVVTTRETFDLREIIAATIEPYKKILSHRIRFEETYAASNTICSADRDKIIIALKNIFTNAIEAIQKEGEITIHLSGDSDQLELTVTDTGSGITENALPKIFDSYFSTKDVGTGLGLPIAKKIIEDHDGRIQVSSQKGTGTVITIRLPRGKMESSLKGTQS